MMGDMPTITDSAHTHTTYGLGNLATPMSMFVGTTATTPFALNQHQGAAAGNIGAARAMKQFIVDQPTQHIVQNVKQEKTPMSTPKRRLVQVFIADPDENVPLDKSLLYSGEQKLTDATDEELFFEIEIKAILEKHNAERTQFVNKKVKERTEFLEPVKIRDLKMVVVNVATF